MLTNFLSHKKDNTPLLCKKSVRRMEFKRNANKKEFQKLLLDQCIFCDNDITMLHHCEALKEMNDGLIMWDENFSEEMKKLQQTRD